MLKNVNSRMFTLMQSINKRRKTQKLIQGQEIADSEWTLSMKTSMNAGNGVEESSELELQDYPYLYK